MGDDDNDLITLAMQCKGTHRISAFGTGRKGREASGGGVDHKDAVVKPKGTIYGIPRQTSLDPGRPKIEFR